MFNTPEWLIDTNIFNKIEYSGSVERVRSMQARTLNNILSLGKMARMIENESLNGNNAYTLTEMMRDLRNGIWSELNTGINIDTYRRNLQRAYIDRLEYLMTAETPKSPSSNSSYNKFTPVNTSQSDIRAVVRAELNTLKRLINSRLGGRDSMSRIHLKDAVERINIILDPQ